MTHVSRLVVSLVLSAAGVVAGCVGDSPVATDGGAPTATATGTGTTTAPPDASVKDVSVPDTSVIPDAIVADAAPFTPKAVAGLALWLDPNAGVVTEASGQVSAWADQTGTITVLQPNGANQPTNHRVNSKPVLLFGRTAWLGAAVGTKLDFGTGDVLVEVVCAVDDPGQGYTTVLYKVPAYALEGLAYVGLQMYALGGAGKAAGGLDQENLALTAASGNTADGRLHVLGFRRAGTRISLRVDGAEVASRVIATRNVDNTALLKVGGGVYSSRNSLADVIIYKGSVTDLEMTAVETYLKLKNGI